MSVTRTGNHTPVGVPRSAPASASGEVKPGSTGPQVQRLKQALKDAGFYKGAVNNQMGPDGVAALKAAKAELKLGGAPDVAGDFTIQKLKQYAKTRGGMDLMKELSSPDSSCSTRRGPRPPPAGRW